MSPLLAVEAMYPAARTTLSVLVRRSGRYWRHLATLRLISQNTVGTRQKLDLIELT